METELAWMFFLIEIIYVIIATVSRAKVFYWLSIIPGALALICFGLALNAH